MFLNRLQTFKNLNNSSCFLWGPRQVGKTSLLGKIFSDSLLFDLLDPRLYEELTLNPGLLQEKVLAEAKNRKPVIIDEIQKIPRLLDIVQHLITKYDTQFILSGSSARKLKRGAGNLLGGRAVRYELYPLVYKEIPNFDLLRALNHGLLPQHYLHEAPIDLIHAYVGDYLKEEIFAEALTRNLQAFSKFLEGAAFSNGEQVNHTNIASDCGVYSSTVRNYFQILEDTLIGRFLPVYQKRPKRRVTKAPKFYFFDMGIVNFLLKRGKIEKGSEVFGKALEHFIYHEIVTHSHYSRLNYGISFWRTSSQMEVDFILGDHEIALEIKGTSLAQEKHLKGLKAFQEEYKVNKSILVSLDSSPRLAGDIRILPWNIFLEELWSGKIIA
ncbi:MAG: ATP-binding protein [Deltaproteobacteria bacterium]|nr:ATP-binding protein [Deltaproteobacteria bacterium]